MTQTSKHTMTVTLPSDLEIQCTREFQAPRDLVFEAFTGAEHLKHWWGPARYEATVCEVDFRVGGKWRIVQKDAQGNEFGFSGEIKEIVRPERIVQTFEWDGMPGHVSTDTAEFEERDGMTIFTARSLFASKEDRDGMLQSGMEEGAAESYDRLEEYVKGMASPR